MKRLPILALLGMLVLIASSCNGPKLLTENLQYKKGDTYKYKQTSDIISTVSVMGQEVVNKQKQGYVFENKITEIAANGDVDMTSTINAIHYEMEVMDSKIVYDSEDPSKNQKAESLENIYADMIGQQFNIILDSKGQLKKFSGATEMLDKMTEQMKKEGKATDGIDAMKAQFNDEAMEQMYSGNMSSLLPTTPVKIGDSWNKTVNMKMLGIKFDNKYTLKKIKDGKAYLDISGVGTPIPDSEPMKMMGMERSLTRIFAWDFFYKK